MVMFGWLAEISVMAKPMGFACGMACWLYIVYETFAGEAAQLASNKMMSQASRSAFDTLRFIVSVGWIIYPLGFAISYFMLNTGNGPLSGSAAASLNVIYNLADFVNKGAFGLCVWSAAASDREDELLGGR